MNCINNNNYTYSPSFQAYYKSSYGKRLEQSLASGKFSDDVVDDFRKIFNQKKNSRDKMGDGGWGEVFRIDDYFVFKTYYAHEPKVGQPVRINTNTHFDKLKTYCGKVLARIGNIEIIRNATRDRHNFLEMAKSIDDGPVAYEHALKEFLSLPQRAFDNIAQDFKTLNGLSEGNLNYRFDTNNANNFLKVGRSIKIVDDIDITPCKDSNDIYALLRVFIQKGGDVEKKKALFKKCILACEKYQLPMESAHKYLMKHVDEIFQNAGVKVSFDEFYKTINEIRKSCPDETTRMLRVREYLKTL